MMSSYSWVAFRSTGSFSLVGTEPYHGYVGWTYKSKMREMRAGRNTGMNLPVTYPITH